jgi:hypothetical protein
VVEVLAAVVLVALVVLMGMEVAVVLVTVPMKVEMVGLGVSVKRSTVAIDPLTDPTPPRTHQ